MDLSKSFTVIFLLSAIFVISESAKQLPCNKNTHKELDRMLAKVNPLGNPDVSFPETAEEFWKVCSSNKRTIRTVEDVNRRCMKGLMNQVISIVLYQLKKRAKVMCRKPASKELKEVLIAGKCVNNDRPKMEKCAQASIDRLVNIKNADQNMKIPLVCCEISKAKACMVGAMTRSDVCTDQHIKTLLDNFQTLSGNSLKTFCSEYFDNTQKCNQIKGSLPPRQKGQKAPKSIVLPVIELFDSFPEA